MYGILSFSTNKEMWLLRSTKVTLKKQRAKPEKVLSHTHCTNVNVVNNLNFMSLE